MNDPIIIVRNLTHLYQPGPLQRQALVDISLEIARGSCAAIVGVTTLGNTISSVFWTQIGAAI